MTLPLGPLEELPGWMWAVPYRGDRVPGVALRKTVRDGANCQLWAYAVLGHFGVDVPALRSDELWADERSTLRAAHPQPLDLVLFNNCDEPYGAHVGVWTGVAVAHLCREVGRPTVWPVDEFAARARYATCLGYKRPRQDASRLVQGPGPTHGR